MYIISYYYIISIYTTTHMIISYLIEFSTIAVSNLASEVLNNAGIDVVKERVDGQVPSQRVL